MQRASGQYDDEIDLFEVMGTIWKWKKGLTLFVFVAVAVGLMVGHTYNPKNVTAKVTVGLSFDGIEKHTYPDGKPFEPVDLISPRVIRLSIDSLKLEGVEITSEAIEAIIGNVSVEPVLSNAMKQKIHDAEKSGQLPNVYPSEYALSVTVPVSISPSVQVMEALLDRMVLTFRERTHKRYALANQISLNIPDSFFNSLDYIDIYRALSEGAKKLDLFLSDRIEKAGYFHSMENGGTFQDVQYELRLLESIDLKRVGAIIGNKLVTRRPDAMIQMYEKRIEDLTLKYKKSLEKSNIAKGLLVEFGDGNRMDAGAIPVKGAESGAMVVDTNFIDRLSGETSQAFLLRNTLESHVVSSDAAIDIAHLNRKVALLKSSDLEGGVKASEIKAVEQSLRRTRVAMVGLAQKTNELNLEYVSGMLEKSVRGVGEAVVSVGRRKSLSLIAVLSGFVALLAGVVVVFVVEAVKTRGASQAGAMSTVERVDESNRPEPVLAACELMSESPEPAVGQKIYAKSV